MSKGLFKNMLTLAFGSVSAKVFMLLSMPVITRLYSPSDLGVLSIFTAIIMIFAPLLSLRYANAINIPRTNGLALNILVLSTIISFALILIMFFVLLIFNSWIETNLSGSKFSEIWPFLIVAVFFSGMFELLSLWLVRTENYKTIAKASFIQSFAGSVSKIIFGFMGLRHTGLVLGQLIQHVSGLSTLLKSARAFSNFRRKVTISRLVFCLGRFSIFPKYRLPSHLLMLLSLQAPILIFSRFFGVESTGQLALAMMALAFPSQVLAQAMSNAYLGEITKLGKNKADNIFKLTKKVVSRMSLAGFIIVVILYFLSEKIFQITFGPEWKDAGAYASIMSLLLVTKFISTPVIHVFTIFEKQKFFLILNMFRAGLIVGVIISIIMFNLEPKQALYFYVALLSFSYITTIFYVFKLLMNEKKHVQAI